MKLFIRALAVTPTPHDHVDTLFDFRDDFMAALCFTTISYPKKYFTER